MADAGNATMEKHTEEYVDSVKGRNSPASPLSAVDGLDPEFTASLDGTFGFPRLQLDQESRHIGPGVQGLSTMQRPAESQAAETGPRSHPSSGRDSYFPPLGSLGRTASTPPSRLSSISDMSSPIPSAYASSSSLRSSHEGEHDLVRTHQALEALEGRPSIVRDDSSASTQTIIGFPLTPEPNDTPPTATPPTPTQTTTYKRREGPVYPDQSFAALQSQFYPPPYQPYSLRTRSSQPSQHSSYASSSLKQPLDQSSVATGAKTVGSTPAHSPGLFTPGQPSGFAMGEAEGRNAATPLLHPTHMQAPKE